MEIQANNHLTWQRARVNTAVSTPVTVSSVKSTWWQDLPSNLTEVYQQGCPHSAVLEQHGMRSAKFCLGLRGAHDIGYTIALDQAIISQRPSMVSTRSQAWQQFYTKVKDTSWPDCPTEDDFQHLPPHIQQECLEHGYQPRDQHLVIAHADSHGILGALPLATLDLHPAMLLGSPWAQKDCHGDYVYNMILLAWPWRAKLPQGWRLYIAAHPFDWSPDYHVFTGCVDANYEVIGNNINQLWHFDHAIDPDYNYFNVELVVAIKHGARIPQGRCVFNMIPVYDPDHVPRQKKAPHPGWVSS